MSYTTFVYIQVYKTTAMYDIIIDEHIGSFTPTMQKFGWDKYGK